MRIARIVVTAACLVASARALAEGPEAVDGTADCCEVTACPESGPGIYGGAEYVLWWLREGRMPALLTTSSFASRGLLGRPDTEVLYGDDRIETRHGDRFNGTRLTLGYWLTDDHSLAIEGSAVFLERDSTHFKATSDGNVLLARPYFSALDGSPQSEIIADPTRSGGFVGYSRVELFTQEANLVLPLTASPAFRLDLLAGAKFLQMRDRADFTAAGKSLPDEATIFGLEDHLRVHDFFYGGQLGLRGEYTLGRWFVNVRGEAALGGNAQQVRTFGERITQTPLLRATEPFGLAVLPTNTGTFQRTVVDCVYEVNVNLGYHLTRGWRIFVGYTFLGWNNSIRAGDQVDLTVNPTQLTGPLVGPARPGIPFKEDFFWAQGVNTGLEYRW
jgi:hypothetical protein